MKVTLLITVAAAAVSVAAGGVKQCHVCKTSQAAATFANLVCDRIPTVAPDCDRFNKSSMSFLQFCSTNQLCLIISKGREELRMCTNKQTPDTLRTTKGILMTVCDRELCNGVGRASPGPAAGGPPPLLLPPLLLAVVAAVAGGGGQ